MRIKRTPPSTRHLVPVAPRNRSQTSTAFKLTHVGEHRLFQPPTARELADLVAALIRRETFQTATATSVFSSVGVFELPVSVDHALRQELQIPAAEALPFKGSKSMIFDFAQNLLPLLERVHGQNSQSKFTQTFQRYEIADPANLGHGFHALSTAPIAVLEFVLARSNPLTFFTATKIPYITLRLKPPTVLRLDFKFFHRSNKAVSGEIGLADLQMASRDPITTCVVFFQHARTGSTVGSLTIRL